MSTRHFQVLKLIFLIIVGQLTHANEDSSVEHPIEYEQHLLQVTQLYAQARLKHYAWRDTEKIITQASELANQGEYMKANELLRQAHQQCVLAEQQASTQAHLSELVPYYLK